MKIITNNDFLVVRNNEVKRQFKELAKKCLKSIYVYKHDIRIVCYINVYGIVV